MFTEIVARLLWIPLTVGVAALLVVVWALVDAAIGWARCRVVKARPSTVVRFESRLASDRRQQLDAVVGLSEVK